jgi:polysaccharide export outer membrane protein
VLEVSIWEAPPAALFGSGGSGAVRSEGLQLSTTASLPELLVGRNGTIFVPFAGTLQVSGRTPQQIEADITQRLSRKAHLPQVIVRITRNATANVTVVGDVASSTRMPLTPRGERLLDALAQAGGTRQPSVKTTVQVTRGDKVVSMALDAVIRDPSQNIVLSTGDVVTAVFQPYSFTVLGASGKNEEVPFEGVGVSLAQALGRMGGLQDQRANAQGVFIFRWEEPFDGMASNGMTDPKGRVPVIYRVNMRDPATFFLAQNFAMQNRDVVYVATAPIAEFQQFVNVVASTLLPLVAAKNAVTVN